MAREESRFTEAELARLPKNVQAKIRATEADVAWWRGKVHAIESRETSAWVEAGGGWAPLEPHARVAFTVGQDPLRSESRFDVRLDGVDLVVSGGDGISIFPVASNVVRVRHDRRR